MRTIYIRCIFFVYIIAYSILVSADVDKKHVRSEENLDPFQDRLGKSDYSMPRRFLEDMNDYEWHISHLKDAKLDSGKKCKETFEDKVKKYKKMLANDASRIKFVSADAIHVDEKELIPEKCEEVEDMIVSTNSSTDGNKTEDVNVRANATNKETVEVKDAATTTKVDGGQAKKKPADAVRRASEYLFSSVEYYDEVPDFEENTCPDVVQVITLELDALKPYDVECELMVEWHSLA